RHIATVEDAVALREQLARRGWVAFVANGSILPRASGTDEHPLDNGAVPFRAPEELCATLDTPHSGPLPGLPIPEGVTLIVGGGYHGKSTLLSAVERGVYDHIPGDGRERVVSQDDAVKIRAEDGRSVSGVNISAFIGTLPGQITTASFSTSDASGSTSQAAALAESLELGARTLLVDEDTSATNFLIRDRRMSELVADEDEPITPLRDRIEWLKGHDVSLVMVVGGSGDYFDVADTVLALKDYRPHDVTQRAKRIALQHSDPRAALRPPESLFTPRRVTVSSIRAERGRKERSTRVRDMDRVSFGATELDLGALEQLAETGQTRFIAEWLASQPEHLRDMPLNEALVAVMILLESKGLHALQSRPDGEWSWCRRFEIGAALNRLRGVRFTTD
ncbi:MAG: ABC-ATPase domain-containing protein, partial [Myxococcota bacterium]